MMIKELKQNILLSLYHRYKGGKSTNIGLKDLCEHDHILFEYHLMNSGLTPSGIE